MAAQQTTTERRPTRRAPAPDQRGTAAERTREKILRAAVAEFGAKGYAGARTAGIAGRAGVNQQLISYYFGGKQGLLDELRRRWVSTEAAVVTPGASFTDAVSGYLDATLEQPDWARLMIWQALGDGPGADEDGVGQRAKLQEAVARLRQRQVDGEVTDGLDAEFLLLVAYAVTFAPIALPGVVSGIFGVEPLSREYRERCREQLGRLAQPQGARR